jgi:hypothetical protein
MFKIYTSTNNNHIFYKLRLFKKIIFKVAGIWPFVPDSGKKVGSGPELAGIWPFWPNPAVLPWSLLDGQDSTILARFQPVWQESSTVSPESGDGGEHHRISVEIFRFRHWPNSDRCWNLACRNPAIVVEFRRWSTAWVWRSTA